MLKQIRARAIRERYVCRRNVLVNGQKREACAVLRNVIFPFYLGPKTD